MKISLPYKPDKICCLTSCPQCGRYISMPDVHPSLDMYELVCSMRSCNGCPSNPLKFCHQCCQSPKVPKRHIKIRIKHYLDSRRDYRIKGSQIRKMTNEEKINIIEEVLVGTY